MIRYGYACKTIGVPGADQKGLTLASATPERLLAVTRHNLRAVGAMIAACGQRGIRVVRISSDVVPLATHPASQWDWREQCAPELRSLGDAIREAGVRVSMHPGQYTVLNSPDAGVVERSVADLAYHAAFLDALGTDGTSRIILHVGGVYGDRAAARRRFVRACEALPDPVRTRLSLENDERLFAIDEVLGLCRDLELPAVFDLLHHALLHPQHGDWTAWLDACAPTWDRGAPGSPGWPGRQKIHYSQQMPGAKPGTHAATILTEPFLAFHKALAGRGLDVMLEVKDKNLSAVKCVNLTDETLPPSRLTDEWARYKYAVMEHSPAAYAAMRGLFRAGRPEAGAVYRLLEQALAEPVRPGHALNAAQHVWGYLNTAAAEADRRRILRAMDRLGAATGDLQDNGPDSGPDIGQDSGPDSEQDRGEQDRGQGSGQDRGQDRRPDNAPVRASGLGGDPSGGPRSDPLPGLKRSLYRLAEKQDCAYLLNSLYFWL